MKYLVNIVFAFFCSLSHAGNLEKCLADTSATTQNCVQKHIQRLTLDSCFSESANIKSDLSKENLKQFCFYNVSEFPTLKSCLSRSENFKVALNHDEALFECVRQFQNQISESQCSAISSQMRYPEKLQHLKRNCSQL